MKKVKLYLEKVYPLAIFLAVELMFLISFNFGDGSFILRIIALVLAVLLTPVLFKELDVSLSKGLFLIIAPLFLYSMVTLFAPAYQINNEVMHMDNIFMQRSTFQLVFNVLGTLSFVLLGYFVSRAKMIKPIYIILAIFGGFALLLLISLLATLINYGPFYRLIYANQVNFYHGQPYNVSSQSSYLLGFKVITANYQVLSNLAVSLTALALGFLFLNDFKNKLVVISISVIAGIGLLTLILLPDFLALLFLVPAIGLGLFLKFKLHRIKGVNIALYVVLGVIGLSAITFLLTAFNVFNITSLLESNKITRKLFLNGLFMRFYGVLRDSFDSRFIFGFNYAYSLETGTKVFPTGNFLFDSLRLDGLFGFVFLVVFLAFAIVTFVRYWNKSEDEAAFKFMFIAFFVTVFARFMFYYPYNIYIFRNDFWRIDHFPFVESSYFALLAFAVGYAHIDQTKKEVATEETVEVNENE
ncbi:MAG TPA: hypothetical protein VFD05_01350 [Bacilli bacterium]|nr:hypothetical protein [Bacilli bacterium]